MTVNLRLRELMLPMLVYPILIPCLLGGNRIDGRNSWPASRIGGRSVSLAAAADRL